METSTPPANDAVQQRRFRWGPIVVFVIVVLLVIANAATMRGAIVGGLVGALAGLLGGGIGEAISARFQSRPAWPGRLGVALAITLATQSPVMSWANALAARVAPTDEERVLEEFRAYPALYAWMEQQRAAGVTDDQMFQRSAALAADGVTRLSDDEIIERARVLGQMLDAVPTDACAGFYQRRQDFTAILAQAPADIQTAVQRMGMGAMAASLSGAPKRTYTKADLNAAFDAIVATVPQDEQVGFFRVILKPEDATAEETCRVARTLYARVSTLPNHRDRLTLATMLAFVEPEDEAAPNASTGQ